jgi:hypothetical protein
MRAINDTTQLVVIFEHGDPDLGFFKVDDLSKVYNRYCGEGTIEPAHSHYLSRGHTTLVIDKRVGPDSEQHFMTLDQVSCLVRTLGGLLDIESLDYYDRPDLGAASVYRFHRDGSRELIYNSPVELLYIDDHDPVGYYPE